MGGRHNKKKSRTQKRDFKEPRQDAWAVERRVPNADGTGYQAAPQKNEAFEEYYKYQKIVPEGQWEDFMGALRTPLPTTFRINGTGKFASDLRDKLEFDFCAKLNMAPTEVEGEPLVPPKPVAWYPDKMAWQLRYSRGQLRKLDALSQIHELLKRENSSGGITRQEAVSMAPPLFLDVQSHHRILDTCAAPGSKTAQILDMLHAEGELPKGFIVANDVDSQRCNLLVHQTKRMNSPALLVTNHDASGFPLVSKPGAPKEEAMYFDRILCDVPCSGDGTLRKAPDLWRRWGPSMGTGLHPLQVRITLHTASLLKVGGRMVYSTCSFNPLEDEAVVAEVLRQGGGSLRLVDVGHYLPDFKRQPGLRSWSVKSTKGSWFTDLAAANEAKHAQNLSESMFPDKDSDAMPLNLCMRVLPHEGDTGGFFIAVLEKTDHIPPLKPIRWKRMKERWQDQRNAQRKTEGPNKAQPAQQRVDPQQRAPTTKSPQAENRDNGEEHPRDEPQNPTDAAVERNSPQQQQQPEDIPQVVNNEGEKFNPGMVEGADDAADAAVVFADAMIDQDAGEAMDAAEDAADAVEHIADMAEDGMERQPSEKSVGEADISRKGSSTNPAQASKPDQSAPQGPNPSAGAQGPNPNGAPHSNKPQRQKKHKSGDEPLALFQDKETLDALDTFFGLDPGFPLRTQTVTRTGFEDQIGARKIYMVSEGIREAILTDTSRQLKVTSAGLKVFDKNDKKQDARANHCAYRISQDGLPLILPYITKQKMRITAAEMLRLLKERYVVVPISQSIKNAEEVASPSAEPPSKKAKTSSSPDTKNGQDDKPAQPEGDLPEGKQGDIEPKGQAVKIPLSDLETIRQLEDIHSGCTICLLRDEEAQKLGMTAPSSNSGEGPMAIVCWRGRSSLSLLVDKNTSAILAEALETAIQTFASQHAPPQS